MLDIIKSVIFGIVEGITEWLPVSSTGHLIILDEIMPMNVSPEFYSLYEIVIQLGAILAVLILFWKKVWPFGAKNNKHPLSKSGAGAYIKVDIFVLWFHFMVSCIPAIIVGLFLDDFFEAIFYNYWTVAIMLILVGVAFIVIETRNKGKKPVIKSMADIDYKTAFIIGIFQVIAAIFPGTSRSGAIIVGALLIGISRKVAAEYAFCLAIPVMLGASLLKLLKFGLHFTGTEAVILLVGMVVAFVVSFFVIKFLLEYIRRHDFKVFGYYRIVLGLIVLAYGIFLA